MHKRLVFFVFFLSAFFANAQLIYYVSLSGNDKNNGAKNMPVKTVKQVCALLDEATRKIKSGGSIDVVFDDGTYSLEKPVSFASENFGRKDISIHFKAKHPGRATISGGMEIKGWQTNDGRIYYASLPKTATGWNFRQLYMNGQRLVRARTPNISGSPKYITMQNVIRKTGGSSIKSPKPEDKFTAHDEYTVFVEPAWVKNWKTSQTAEIVILTNWASTRKKIQSINPQTGAIVLQPPHVLYYGYNRPKKDWPCFLENTFEFLDAENEWYLDSVKNILYCIPPKGVDLNKAKVIAPVLPALVQGYGKPGNPVSNIHFEGICFEHTSWTLPAGGVNGRQGCYDYNGDNETGYMPSAIDFEFAKNISFKKCSFQHLGSGGIAFRNGSQNVDISGNIFSDISGNGISIGQELKGPYVPEQITISNNEVTQCGQEFFGGTGIFVTIARHVLISHNLVYNLPYTGIATGWWWPENNNNMPYTKWQNYPDSSFCAGYINIEYNHIYDVMQEVSDGGGIYTLGPQPHSTMRFNLIHGIKSNSVPNSKIESQPVFFDERTAGFTVEGNVTYDYHAGAYRQNKPAGDKNYVWIDNHFNNTSKDSLQFFEAGKKSGLESIWKEKLKTLHQTINNPQ